MATTTQAIEEIYIGLLGRAADAGGLAYWTAEIDGGTLTLEQLRSNIVNEQPEYAADLGSKTRTQVVSELYNRLFERAAEAEGLEYWVNGDGSTVNVDQLVLALSAGAAAADRLVLDNKVEAASYYSANTLDADYTADGAKASVDSVDATTASIDASKAATDSGTQTAGSTFTLTSSVDTFTGTSGDDTFVADDTGTDTASAADTLDGGAGTDTLKIFSDGGAFSLPALTSIETVELFDHNQAADFSAQASLTTVNVNRGEGDATITVGAGVTVGLKSVVIDAANGGAGKQTIAYKATDTSATLNLTAVTDGANDANEDVAITGAALTAVTVNATGTKSEFDALDLAAAKTITINAAVDLNAPVETTGVDGTLTVTGAGKVTLGALDDGIDTVDASANTGGISLTLDANTETDTKVTGGSGDDTVTTNGTLATTHTTAIDGGAGTDTIVIAAVADLNAADEGARYVNFETVQTATSFNMALVAGLTGLTVTATAGATSFTGLTATQAANVTVNGAVNAAGISFALANDTGTTDSLSLALGDSSVAAGVAIDADSITANGFETINLATAFGASATAGAQRTATVADFTADKVTAINLTGAAFDLENVATAKAVTIDASALIGDGATSSLGLTAAGSLFAGSTVTGSGFVDTVTVGASGSTYNLGAGKDVITAATQAIIAATTIDGGADADILRISEAAATTATLTIDDNTFKTISNVETIDFSGATAGLFTWTLGGYANAIATASGGLITATAAALAGGTNAADDIVVDASGLGGTNALKLTLTTTSAGANDNDVTITGSDGADTIAITEATAAADGEFTISGGKGDDTITLTKAAVGASVIALSGGAGNDTITGSAGIETITGGTGADIITTGASVDIVMVAAGDSDFGTITTPSVDVTNADIITVIATDTLNLTGALETEADYDNFTEVAAGGAITTTLTTNEVGQFVGVYDSATNMFTSSATNAAGTASTTDVDALFYTYAIADATDTVATEGLVIIGVAAQVDGAITNGIITFA
ncbi:hypothetical protein A9Q90_10065 [Gammaproteobacteria bacterium 54_18_T64]|nr:hypothetical protein A9Q90_10065 [Gammaproteobacteria bacterium 54_18_T64]